MHSWLPVCFLMKLGWQCFLMKLGWQREGEYDFGWLVVTNISINYWKSLMMIYYLATRKWNMVKLLNMVES